MVKNPCIRSRSVLYTGTSQFSRGCWGKPGKKTNTFPRHSTSELFSRLSEKQKRFRSLLYREHFSYQNPISHASHGRSRSDEPGSLAGTSCYESCRPKMRSNTCQVKWNTTKNMKELVESGVKHINELFLSYSVHLSETFAKYSQRYPIRPIFCHCTLNQQLLISCHIFT